MTMAVGIPWSIFRYESGDTIPTLTVPGETVVWDRGDGQGEYSLTKNTFYFVYGARYDGNTFTLGTTVADGDFVVNRIKIWCHKVGSPGTVNVHIKAVDGSQHPTGAALSSGSFDGDAITANVAGELITVTMSPATLKASTEYAWYITVTGVDSSNEINLHVDDTEPYLGGTRVFSGDSGSSWSVQPADFYFDLEGGGTFLLINDNENVVHYAVLTAYPT